MSFPEITQPSHRIPAQPQPSRTQSMATDSVARNRVYTPASRHYRPKRQTRNATLPCTRRHPQEEDPIPSIISPPRQTTQLASHAAIRAVGCIDPNRKACPRLRVLAPAIAYLEPRSMSQRIYSTAHGTTPHCTFHTSHATIPGSRSADPSPYSQARPPGITHPHAAPQASVLGPGYRNQPHGPAPQPTNPFHNPHSHDPAAQPHSTNLIPHIQDARESPPATKPIPYARDLVSRAARWHVEPRTQQLAPRTRPPRAQNSRYMPRSTHPGFRSTVPTPQHA